MACTLFSRLLHGRRLHSSRESATVPPVPAAPSSFIILGFRPTSLLSTQDISRQRNGDFNHSDHDENLFLLLNMAGQGPPHLLVRNVTLNTTTSFAEIDRTFYRAEGYVGMRLIKQVVQPDESALNDFVYTFRTSADAASALHNNPRITIGAHTYDLGLYLGDFEEAFEHLQHPPNRRTGTQDQPQTPERLVQPENQPPRKRLKKGKRAELIKVIVCGVCGDHVDGDWVAPCRQCKDPRCHDCLRQQFEHALKNMDQMPVTCCGRVVHHEVVRGLLPTDTFEEYKLRYDERVNSIDPLYCPVPTCSTFIPPRLFGNAVKVACLNNSCKTVICIKCKEAAADDHTCNPKRARNVIVESFHYKLCPRCGTGIMRLYGCPHVRCACGAHWCWDCQRPMLACYQKPCSASRDQGNHSEGENEFLDSDGELVVDEHPEDLEDAAPVVETIAPPFTRADLDAAVVPTPVMPSTIPAPRTQDIALTDTAGEQTVPAAAAAASTVSVAVAPEAVASTSQQPIAQQPAEAQVNLDDPDDFDWEGEDLDLGDEPSDESWDIWGCRHIFQQFDKDRCHDHYLPRVDAKSDIQLSVECMGCFQMTKVWDDTKEFEAFKEGNCHATGVELDTNKLKQMWAVQKAAELFEKQKHTAEAETSTKPKRESKLRGDTFECRSCGVVFCKSCKKASRRRIHKEWSAGDKD